MIYTIENLDELAAYNAMDSKEISSSLSLEDVEKFIQIFNVPILHTEKGFIIPTICHNPLEDASTMKLYYYQKDRLFHCFTECGESFNLVQLYRKVMEINSHSISYHEAADFIKSFFSSKGVFLVEKKSARFLTPEGRYEKEAQIIELDEYKPEVMSMFVRFLHPTWEKEGITQKTLDFFNIKFSIHYNKIIIPHYDINHRLIGIRVRNIESEDVAYAKYMPLLIGGTMYNHIISYNLYGIAETKEAIRTFKRAIVVEGEKSVLLSREYYGRDSVVVAACGNKLNRFQVALLTSLGVDEIVIAFDKEFVDRRDKNFLKWKKHLENICRRYQGLANFSYIIDERGWLEQKDSPIDKGAETFEKLYEKCRIKVK